MRKSLWSPDEDEKLRQYVATHGCGNWSDVAKHTGLLRCGKSCRLRWINYLRPDLKRGPFTAHEVRIVVNLHKNLGNSWSKIATHLPGRTDNDVKNFWHSYTRSRRLQRQQQQQQTNNTGPHNSNVHSNERERHGSSSSYNELYNHLSNTNVDIKQVRPKEEKEYGNAAHHEPQLPPALVFLSNANINKGVGESKAPSIKVDNSHTFQFTKANHNIEHLPPFTSASNTTPHHHSNISTHLLSQYPSSAHSLQPPIQGELKGCLNAPSATTIKPVMVHNHLHSDAQGAIAAMYKRVQSQITKSKLGSHIATSLDHPIPPLPASLSSAVCSMSADIQSRVNSAALDDWSLMVSPSMQLTYLINSHASADDGAEVSFDQATYIDENGKPAPESLQSVIWTFFNQQEASSGVLPGPLASPASDHHFLHQHRQQISSIPAPTTTTTDLIHAPADLAPEYLLDAEAFSTSAALQYLQSQLAADCF